MVQGRPGGEVRVGLRDRTETGKRKIFFTYRFFRIS